MNTSAPILQFFNESEEEIPLSERKALSTLQHISHNEQAGFSLVEVVFVDEAEILRINREHLEREYVTDIITFRYDEGEETGDKKSIEGTLFCCAPRIKEQAGEFNESPHREFLRIFIHGLLHLTGYNDQTEQEKQTMTRLEDRYLELAEANK